MRKVIAPKPAKSAARVYKEPTAPKVAAPRTLPVDSLGCPVIPANVRVAGKVRDRDSRAVEEGAMTGTELARKAAQAMAEWKPAAPRKEPKWLTVAKSRKPPVAPGVPVAPKGPAFLSGVLVGEVVTK